jgi:membrane protease YdiL (CAAX protease family)
MRPVPWRGLARRRRHHFLSVVTPIGEGFLFRGVATTVPLRYGAVAGVVFRWSGSIWPAVTVHVVVNLPTIPVMVLAGMAK